MCVDVDEAWEMSWSDSAAALKPGETGKCYECNRDLAEGELHTFGCWGPLAYRYCQIEGCMHEECDNGEEYIDEDEMRFCRQCLAARVWLEKVCHSWLYGGILEDLKEHFIEEMRPIHSLPLGRIVVASKNDWRRRDGTLWAPEVVEGWANQGAEMVAAAIGRDTSEGE